MLPATTKLPENCYCIKNLKKKVTPPKFPSEYPNEFCCLQKGMQIPGVNVFNMKPYGQG